jgi:hypothetical protein
MDCPTRRVPPFDWEFFFSSLQYGKEKNYDGELFFAASFFLFVESHTIARIKSRRENDNKKITTF